MARKSKLETRKKRHRSLRKRMTGVSWHEGCPVPLSGLRDLRIGYWGFDRKPHVGRMVVAGS